VAYFLAKYPDLGLTSNIASASLRDFKGAISFSEYIYIYIYIYLLYICIIRWKLVYDVFHRDVNKDLTPKDQNKNHG